MEKLNKYTTSPLSWVNDYGDYLYAFKKLFSKDLAEDLLQDTFLAAFQAKETFKGKSTEKTWLASILKRKIMKLLFKIQYLFIIIIIFLTQVSCLQDNVSHEKVQIDYSDKDNWAFYIENDLNGVDVFFVAPTVFAGDSTTFNMALTDTESKANFVGAINMEKGIYQYANNFYAAFYRQAALVCYEIRGFNDHSVNPKVEEAFNLAYTDVETAFDYYLSQSDRPFVLAGFSQGSEMLIRLIKNRLATKGLQNRHIATYAIGWRLTEAEAEQYPQLENAKSEKDLGVIITFSSEAEFINTSIIVPQTTLSINPLSWTTDTNFASSDLNMGACFTDFSGNIVNEVENITGAYICSKRGSLKVPDIVPDEYPPILPIFKKGEYHIYDYMFFYRNLQNNVKTRIMAYEDHMIRDIKTD